MSCTKKGLGNLMQDQQQEEARQTAEQLERDLANVTSYTIRNAAEILAMEPEPPLEIWGGITLTNDIFEIIGASGIGKSRIVLNLAVTQALAGTRPAEDQPQFAGLDVSREPLKWLLLGTENDLYRYHTDLKGMMSEGCDENQRKVLGERVFMSTLEGDGDSYMALNDPENIQRLKKTIAGVKPDIVVCDPWGDFCGGSELEDQTVRETVGELRKLRIGVKEKMAIVIINHSRMGALENLKADGLDAANFGKNSKALYTISRCVWNLNYLTPNPDDGWIGMFNAKRSRGERYPKRCIQFEPNTMTYRYCPDFDFDAAKSQLVATSRSQAQNSTDVRAGNFKQHMKNGCDACLKLLESGPQTKTAIDTAAKNVGVPKNDVPSVVELLVNEHGITTWRPSVKNAPTYYGSQDQIEAIQAKFATQNPQKNATHGK